MAAITPNTLFPNMTSDGTNITIPITDLPGLTAAEVDPTPSTTTPYLIVRSLI